LEYCECSGTELSNIYFAPYTFLSLFFLILFSFFSFCSSHYLWLENTFHAFHRHSADMYLLSIGLWARTCAIHYGYNKSKQLLLKVTNLLYFQKYSKKFLSEFLPRISIGRILLFFWNFLGLNMSFNCLCLSYCYTVYTWKNCEHTCIFPQTRGHLEHSTS
jgi:hypothetical protein